MVTFNSHIFLMIECFWLWSLFFTFFSLKGFLNCFLLREFKYKWCVLIGISELRKIVPLFGPKSILFGKSPRGHWMAGAHWTLSNDPITHIPPWTFLPQLLQVLSRFLILAPSLLLTSEVGVDWASSAEYLCSRTKSGAIAPGRAYARKGQVLLFPVRESWDTHIFYFPRTSTFDFCMPAWPVLAPHECFPTTKLKINPSV